MSDGVKVLLGVLAGAVIVLSFVSTLGGSGMMGQMMSGSMMGGGLFGMFFTLVFWALVIGLIVALVVWIINQTQRR
jgi:uncharacterized membrane protein